MSGEQAEAGIRHERGRVVAWAIRLAIVGVVLGAWFHLGTLLIHTTNHDRRSSDQLANMDSAEAARADWYPFRTNAVSNGLWPWLAAKVWTPEPSDFFVRGKWLNLALTGFLLGVAALIASRHLALLPWALLLLLAALGSLLPRAVYFQPETLSYLFFTAAFFTGLTLLSRNPWWLFVLFGLLLGIAYLAKPSVDPLILCWVGAGIFRGGLALLPKRDGAASARVEWDPRRHLAGLFVVAATFLLVTGPRLAYSNATFGDPFFNMPKYWMWHDDYGKESVPFLVQHGHKDKIAALPPEQVPSAANYFRTHTPEQAWQRLSEGTSGKLTRFLAPAKGGYPKKNKPWRYLLAHRGLYPVTLATGLVFFLLLALGAGVRPSAGLVSGIVFGLGAFTIYTLAYGWYEPIGRGDRFMMALYLPLCAGCIVGIETLRRRLSVEAKGRIARIATPAAFTLYALLLGAAIWNFAALLLHPAFDTGNTL